jgi:alcohol dehydrogenase, propanol-preferring
MSIQPAGLRPEVAAIACDAGVTAFNAVYNVAGVSIISSMVKQDVVDQMLPVQIKEGTKFTVLIFGIGGLGHLAVQYAKHFGAKGE